MRSNNSLSIIIPAYNEEACLQTVVTQVAYHAQQDIGDYEIIIVDDGSVDDTYAVARNLQSAYPQIKIVRHNRNCGSGMSIKTGIANSCCDLIIYIPADGQFNISEIKDYVMAMEGYDIVIGARSKRSDYSWFRLLSSRVFIFLINNLFKQNFKDVNWVHAWRREIFSRVHPRSHGVFMLEEILVRAGLAGYKINEVNSFYIPRRGGKAKGSSIKTIMITIFEMMVFWLELHFKRIKP